MPFPLAALTDEIDPDLDAALDVLTANGIREAELRTVFGKNVLELTDDEAARCLRQVRSAGCAVSGLSSPVGKSELAQPAEHERSRLRRALELASLLETRRIRVFSFYPAETPTPTAGDEVAARLASWAELARQAGALLVLENEVGLWGDVPERCAQLLERAGSPHLRFAWDPANFIRSGVDRPFDAGWSLLQGQIACAHVKDCRSDGAHTPAGSGAGQWPELMRALVRRGGVPLVMEPHLQLAGHSVGFTGPERFREAVDAIRALLPAGQ